MKNYFSFFLVWAVLVFCTPAYAQNDIKKTNDKKSSGLASLNFLSNNVYFGRADDTAIAYLTPMLRYQHKLGFFVDGSASYALTGKVKQFDLFTLDGGYNFTSQNERFDGSLVGSKYFYNDGSQSIKSAIKGSVYLYAEYDFDWLFTDVSGGANFSDKTDVELSAGLGHNFYTANSKLLISPSFYFYSGTQHFFTSFKNKQKKLPRGSRPPQPQVTLKDESSFKMLDYEFTVPASFEKNKFTFYFTPSYSIPVNPVIYPNAPNLSEKLKNRFYAEAEVAYRF